MSPKAAASAHFKPALFRFLRDLAANNDRDWFKANKERYERDVREPCQHFISDFGPRLAKLSPHFTADPRPVGGSMFRIYRDTRFSKDKSPYKTYVGTQFRHQRAKDVHAPGFYLHLQPGECFIGLGIWHPDGPSLAAIRQAIDADPARWKRIKRGKRFAEALELGGDSLKTAPKGYSVDHPLIEDLRRKDFIAHTKVSQKAITSPDFLAHFTATCRAGLPFVKFLCDAVEVKC